MSITNLTPHLLEAKNRSSFWLNGGFDRVIKLLAEKASSEVNWDETVPETWAGIDVNKIPIAVIHIRFPLIIVVESAFMEVSQSLQDGAISFIIVENFDVALFKIDKDKLPEIFPYKWSDVVNPDEFTIRELVYAT